MVQRDAAISVERWERSYFATHLVNHRNVILPEGNRLQRPQMPHALVLRRHQRYRFAEVAHATAQGRQAGIVIIVAKAIFSAPHRKDGAGASPLIKHRRGVEIGIWNKAFGVFPVIVEEELASSMRR